MDNDSEIKEAAQNENLGAAPQDVQKKTSVLGAILLVVIMALFIIAIFAISRASDPDEDEPQNNVASE